MYALYSTDFRRVVKYCSRKAEAISESRGYVYRFGNIAVINEKNNDIVFESFPGWYDKATTLKEYINNK